MANRPRMGMREASPRNWQASQNRRMRSTRRPAHDGATIRTPARVRPCPDQSASIRHPPGSRHRGSTNVGAFRLTPSGPSHSDRYGVPRELLYAVARKESWFSRAAVSSAGALGLFQFLPRTFEVLNERWQLLDGHSGATVTTEGYLTDALLSIDLGARWFRHLIQVQSGSVVRAIMEHNAGGTAVGNWTNAWELEERDDDVEYMVETARYGQTRIFTRRVLELMAVAHGMGRLDH